MSSNPQQLLTNEKTVLTLLDVCGSCITDVMYNFLHDRAIAIHEKTGKGLADAYREVLIEYVKESASPKFYSLLLNTMHHYVRISTIYQNISYPDCIALYAGLFVPHMYLPSLTSEQKLNILSMIIGNTVKEFVNEILREHISCIIDDHQDPINVEILQDAVLKILIKERNISYDRFIQSQKKPKKVSIREPQKKSLNKISDAFKRAVADRAVLKKKNLALVKKNKQLATQFNELKTLFLSQLAVQKDQTKLIQELKNDLQQNATKVQVSKQNVDSDTIVSPILEPSHANDDIDDMFSISVQYVDDQST
jgi:hypothetical protein